MQFQLSPEHIILGSNIRFYESPNQGDFFEYGLPDTILIHYTALADLKISLEYLTDPQREVSAHLLIGKEGEIIQLVPFNKIAWHAGKSKWGERTSLNKYSIGIELDNAGYLEKRGGKFFSWFGQEYSEAEVYENIYAQENEHAYWHKYSEKQIESLTQVCRFLKNQYPIQELLGHSDVSPERKLDPGPAFPLNQLRSEILSNK